MSEIDESPIRMAYFGPNNGYRLIRGAGINPTDTIEARSLDATGAPRWIGVEKLTQYSGCPRMLTSTDSAHVALYLHTALLDLQEQLARLRDIPPIFIYARPEDSDETAEKQGSQS